MLDVTSAYTEVAFERLCKFCPPQEQPFFTVSKIVFPEHDQRIQIRTDSIVDPDLGPNCLQRFSTDDNVTASKERVKSIKTIQY